MTWTCRVSRQAAKQLRRLPRDRQQQIARAINEMETNPLKGDIAPIKSGKFKGAMRKRVGQYRIIFSLEPSEKAVLIAAILARSEGTYR